MDNIKYNMQCFKKQKDKYEEEYKRYFEACLEEKQKNRMTTVILTTEEFDMVDALRQAIQAAVVLLDNDKIGDDKEIKFLSGIRYINNTFKHSKKVFEVSHISQAGFHLQYKVDDEKGINITDVRSEPMLLFGDLDQVPMDQNISTKESNMILRQKANYVSQIKGKNPLLVLDTLGILLQKYCV